MSNSQRESYPRKQTQKYILCSYRASLMNVNMPVRRRFTKEKAGVVLWDLTKVHWEQKISKNVRFVNPKQG